jgi:hypothetical protein
VYGPQEPCAALVVQVPAGAGEDVDGAGAGLEVLGDPVGDAGAGSEVLGDPVGGAGAECEWLGGADAGLEVLGDAPAEDTRLS